MIRQLLARFWKACVTLAKYFLISFCFIILGLYICASENLFYYPKLIIKMPRYILIKIFHLYIQ